MLCSITVGVTRLLSKLSSALERHVHCRWHGGDEEVAVDLRSPGREQWEVEVHLLNMALRVPGQ